MLVEDRVIIALDFSEQQQAEAFLQMFRSRRKPFIKVGYQLFYLVGPQWVAQRKEEGYPVFLDLKLHDIPQTVAGAVRSLTKLGVDFLTIHASGGTAMLEAAVDAASDSNIKLLAVTQLTSTDQMALNDELRIPGRIEDSVLHLSRMAHRSGVDGVICSGHEVTRINEEIATDFLTVTPGIRPLGSGSHDQKRVMTPSQAIRAGADYLVIGRPITQASSPVAVYEQVIREIEQLKEI